MNSNFKVMFSLRRIWQGTLLAIVGLVAIWSCRPVAAQGQGGAGGGAGRGAAVAIPTDAAGHPDISGYWELRFDSRSVTPASLTKDAAAKTATQREHDLLAIRWCANAGVPYIMGDTAPLDIRQGLKDIAILAKTVSSVRYIYIDGRSHPDKDELDATTNGHSIGHWDGDTLVVDTVGFSDRGITAIPGGGFRTPKSHLIENVHLINGGRQLSVIFTWDDPSVFQKPHSYEFRYYKVPDIGYPLQYPCNAMDPGRAKFLIPDTQAAAGPK